MAWAYAFTSNGVRLHAHRKDSDHGNKPCTRDGVQHLNFTICGYVIGDTCVVICTQASSFNWRSLLKLSRHFEV
jgi:hypothetical protein